MAAEQHVDRAGQGPVARLRMPVGAAYPQVLAEAFDDDLHPCGVLPQQSSGSTQAQQQLKGRSIR